MSVLPNPCCRLPPAKLTRGEAIAAYHRLSVPTTTAEFRTAAALLGEDPDAVAPRARSTSCELAADLLDNLLVDTALEPSELTFLERLERGVAPLSARTLERLLQMDWWVRGSVAKLPEWGPAASAASVPAQWCAPLPGGRPRLPQAPAI